MDNINTCMRYIDTTMSEDETRSIINIDKDCEQSDTDHMLPEAEGNKRVGEAGLRENGGEEMNLERVSQISTGSRRESDTQRNDLHTHVGNSGKANIQSSRRHLTQPSENSNVHRDSEAERKCCDGGGGTNPEEKLIFPEGETKVSTETSGDGLQVPDGGWGWLVALGTFFTTVSQVQFDSNVLYKQILCNHRRRYFIVSGRNRVQRR